MSKETNIDEMKILDPTNTNESDLVNPKGPESRNPFVEDLRMIDGTIALLDEVGRINITRMARQQDVPQHKGPAFWLRLESAQRVVSHYTDEYDCDAVVVINGGPDRGTYVVPEIALGYGMWVNMGLYSYVVDVFFSKAPAPARGTAAISLHSDRATIGKEIEDVNNNLLKEIDASQIYVNDRRSPEVSLNISDFVFNIRRHRDILSNRDEVIFILQDSGMIGKSIIPNVKGDTIVELYPTKYVHGVLNMYVKECEVFNDIGDYVGSCIRLTPRGQGYVFDQILKRKNIRS